MQYWNILTHDSNEPCLLVLFSIIASYRIVVAILLLPVLACGTSGIPQVFPSHFHLKIHCALPKDSFMTILLMCGMFGLPTTKLASILAVDWLLDRLDGLCKVWSRSRSHLPAFLTFLLAGPDRCHRGGCYLQTLRRRRRRRRGQRRRKLS